VITEVASIRVRSWSDLVSALALQPFDEPVAIGWRRGEAAREAVMVPRTTVYGEISGRGRLEGSFVFDVDHGRLVRMDLDVCRFSWQERRENRTHREAWQGTASLQIMTGDTEEADGERE
jgi:hypothetical protein